MDESGWLIERPIAVTNKMPEYWGKAINGLGFTPENIDAIRFARKADAEAVINGNGWADTIAVEHGWSDDNPN